MNDSEPVLKVSELGVSILNAQEGDILVISCQSSISQETAARISLWVEKEFPKIKVMVLGDGLKVDGVIRGIV